MYNVGEIVSYDAEGICKIIEITNKTFAGQTLPFYVLQSISKRAITIYVPVNNKKQTDKMRKVLSSKEIYALIESINKEDDIWIEDDAKRKEEYKKIMHSGDRRDIVLLAKTLRNHQIQQEEKGKRLHISDEQYLKTAERLLHEEFSHVLNIELDQVSDFITNKINVNEKTFI